jgi:hypothetical protein
LASVRPKLTSQGRPDFEETKQIITGGRLLLAKTIQFNPPSGVRNWVARSAPFTGMFPAQRLNKSLDSMFRGVTEALKLTSPLPSVMANHGQLIAAGHQQHEF